MSKIKIILASGSPRRKQLFELAGIPCEIFVSNADETASGEPEKQVTEIALRKAKAVFFAREKNACGALPIFAHEKNDEIIVAADTLVYIDGEVLGKPKNFDEAFAMLKKLSGRRHTVFTGVAILRGEYEKIFFDATQVFFRELSDEEIFSYIATGEPFDKAGAYGVQERGAVLVEKIDGDFFTVVGLPISKVWQVLTLELELKF